MRHSPRQRRTRCCLAGKLLGVRLRIFSDLEEMRRKVPAIDAVDVVTDPSVHHEVVSGPGCRAARAGGEALSEAPHVPFATRHLSFSGRLPADLDRFVGVAADFELC